jgi:sulfur carrier protein ThiS
LSPCRGGGIPTEVTVRRRFDRTPVRVELERSPATVEDVLRARDIRLDSVVVVRGKTPIPITDRVVDGEELELIEVVSGG